MKYIQANHRKYLLLYHLILVVKYRKQLLNKEITKSLKSSLVEIANASEFIIEEMEVDQDHLHLMINTSPVYSVSQIVRKLKQSTTKILWSKHKIYLQSHFWKERTFWSDGYFVCTVGNASIETIRHYIQDQGEAYIPATQAITGFYAKHDKE